MEEISKLSLFEALTKNKESRFSCLVNIRKILEATEELEKAMAVLKDSLNLELGETFSDEYITVSKTERTTHSFKEIEEHKEAVANVKKIEDMLKVQKKSKQTTSTIITVRKK